MQRGRLARIAARAVLSSVAVAGAGWPVTAFAATTAQAPGGEPVQVIVSAGDVPAATTAVRDVGGTVDRELGVVSGVSAHVPAGAVDALRAEPGIRSVTGDMRVRLKGNSWNAGSDSNSMFNVTRQTGATDTWLKKDSSDNYLIGTGVGIALLDSGVTPVKGLATPGRIINGPDLSFESQASNLRHLDTFGHGTHMAGIILGRDPELTSSGSINNTQYFAGMAPGANLINMKVASADGAVDVSQVLAAIDWVVQHRNDSGLNIRVLNLSFGTDSTQDPRLDPLSYAVEAAWKKGIVVVVAVGNDGTAATTVSMPAANPYVIAVGAADSMGTDARVDDTVASFSSRGSTTRHADLTAPGKSIVSLRDPSSFVDVNYPTGLVPGDSTGRFFRGSGSSQATAVVSGAVALLLQQRPSLTPDQVKRLLMTTADAMPAADALGKGAGELNIKNAIAAPTPTYTQTFTAAAGNGSLEKARGSAHVADPVNGTELTGEVDIMGKAWTPAAWTVSAKNGSAWLGGVWNNCTWTGTGYNGSSYASKTWGTSTWSGTNWSGRTWSSTAWSSAVWDGRLWSGRTWSGRLWSGRLWSGDYWSSSIWR